MSLMHSRWRRHNEGIAVAVYAGRRRWDEFPPEDLQEKKETAKTVQSRPVSVCTDT